MVLFVRKKSTYSIAEMIFDRMPIDVCFERGTEELYVAVISATLATVYDYRLAHCPPRVSTSMMKFCRPKTMWL